MHFLLVKSEHDLGQNVVFFDVGHGDCLLLLDRSSQGLLVDCGSWRPHSHLDVPKTIEKILSKKNNCGFVVSHYHFDHYSLFHWLEKPNRLFSKIYVPYIPSRGPGFDAARAIMTYMSAATLVDYSYYRILPEIFSKAERSIIPCKRGDFIREANQNLKVLWPDITNPLLGSDEIRRIAKSIKQSIEPFLTDWDFRIPHSEGEDLTIRFFEYLEYLRTRKLSEEKKRLMQRILGEIEGQFKKLANIFSLVASSYRKRHSRFLFLADVDDQILSNLKIPGKREFNCIKAAHHGTSFGNALINLSTEFLLISRNKKEFPVKNIHDGYLFDIHYKMVLSTDFLHHCLIL